MDNEPQEMERPSLPIGHQAVILMRNFYEPRSFHRPTYLTIQVLSPRIPSFSLPFFCLFPTDSLLNLRATPLTAPSFKGAQRGVKLRRLHNEGRLFICAPHLSLNPPPRPFLNLFLRYPDTLAFAEC
ncbi:hypothetical protein CDAR_436581 [Caerostris darwini]|uniref:Uncharacterized protein n=1 Tax=Caerostris darwini TaxID=1538125 RepID=A0AAV4SEM2_9ARAC|nr:hypothetical protein CDAR_436581 [Caerostris darwini]